MTLRFRLGSIPILVEPGFWLFSAVLGWNGLGVNAVLVWVACVFAAVLCHELGHALAARSFGGQPEVTLYAMGGITFPRTPEGIGRRAHVIISLAGPIAGFLLGGVVFAGALLLMTHAGTPLAARIGEVWTLVASAPETLGARAIKNLLWINIGWGAVNLVPVLPLDGGNVARMLLGDEETGWLRALTLSVVVGPVLAVASYLTGMTWAAMLFGLFSISAVRQLMEGRSRRADRLAGFDEKLKQATAAIEENDYERAAELAAPVARGARNVSLRYAGTHLQAMALLELGRPQEALEVLKPVPPSHADETLVGACLLASGRAAEAVPHLETAARQGAGKHAWELLADALDRTGEPERAEQARAQAQGDSAPPA